MDIKFYRTRWRRWLGAKTRVNEFEWTNLLDCNYIAWAYRVSGENYKSIEMMTRESTKQLYNKAIDKADMDDFFKLDGIFCSDQFDRKYKR